MPCEEKFLSGCPQKPYRKSYICDYIEKKIKMMTEKDVAKVVIEAFERMSKEMESVIETLEIMGDEEAIKSIEEGLKDVEEGNIISFDDFLKKHGYK